MSGEPKAGRAAVPRSRKFPSGVKRPTKVGAAQQHRPTTLREDSIPYRVNGATTERKLRFIDLFCGIGGFRLAFEKAGGRCVFSSDWDKFSRQTYEANFGDNPHGDIHNVAVADIPKFDILCAGFPCQPFSLAGVSKKLSLGRKHGFEDVKQGNLFFTLADIIDYHRPAAFVLENVKHLVRHDQGRTFEIIHNTLTEALGYHGYHRVIDARSVVPQHRERIFLVGFREPRYFEFPEFPPKARSSRASSTRTCRRNTHSPTTSGTDFSSGKLPCGDSRENPVMVLPTCRANESAVPRMERNSAQVPAVEKTS